MTTTDTTRTYPVAYVLLLHDPLNLGTNASTIHYAMEGGDIGRALRPGMDADAVTAVVRAVFEGMYEAHADAGDGDYRAIADALIERGIVPKEAKHVDR